MNFNTLLLSLLQKNGYKNYSIIGNGGLEALEPGGLRAWRPGGLGAWGLEARRPGGLYYWVARWGVVTLWLTSLT